MDPYAVLGLKRGCSNDDIRAAFRRLAKRWHPDVNPGDAAAAERFRRVSEAHDMIGDPGRRGSHDESGAGSRRDSRRDSRASGASFDWGTDNCRGYNVFREDADGCRTPVDHDAQAERSTSAGSKAGPQSVNDVSCATEIVFLEAVHGTRKRLTLPTGETLDLKIHPGTEDGTVLRLRGKGLKPAGCAPTGDAFVTVKVQVHDIFEQRDGNIFSEVQVTLDDAVLGGTLDVATVSGHVQLRLPGGVQQGQVMRLRGKGVPAHAGRPAGDHLVKLKITMPEPIDDDMRTFFEGWRSTHRGQPRAR